MPYDKPHAVSPGLWALAWRRLRADRVAMVSLAIVAAFLLLMVIPGRMFPAEKSTSLVALLRGDGRTAGENIGWKSSTGSPGSAALKEDRDV